MAEGAIEVLGAWLVVCADDVEGTLGGVDLLLTVLELKLKLEELELMTPESGGFKLYP